MPDRIYATLAEVIFDLELSGVTLATEAKWLDRLRAASEWLDKWGPFIPVTEPRRFDACGGKTVWIDPIISATTVTHDGSAVSSNDYLLYPRNKFWENGPYNRIEIDPDASGLTAWNNERDVLAIAGQWGKYSETGSTGATVANSTEITSGGTSLLVANGSLLSPGMVLLIESKQLLITATGAVTAVSGQTTSEALDTTEEGVDVANGALNYVGEVIRVDYEDMRIRAIDTNTLTVDRGWNGTTRAAHNTSTAVYAYRTYTVLRAANGTTAAAHANGTAISRYLPPYDVNWLIRQIAGLMHKKAQGGFVGKSGSAELGTIFYMDEFPKKQVEDVKSHYRIVSI